ncbi:MAG: hypothetical protein E7675_06360 [Ruminococcaceae bacterium]|nr:hypothetical protein [Oscillospiraceae bacterium]
MKIKEALTETGMMIPDHNICEELLYIWLSRVEGLVITRIMGGDGADIKYTPEENEGVLRVPDPYSAIYPLYLQTMIYLYLGEYDRYNHLNQAFSSAWSDFAKHYIRTKG